MDNTSVFFRNCFNDDTWLEIEDNHVCHKFKLVKIANKEILLFNASRNLYLKIADDRLSYSNTRIDEIDTLLYVGKWNIFPRQQIKYETGKSNR